MKRAISLLLIICCAVLISSGCTNSKKTMTKDELLSNIEKLNSDLSAKIKYNGDGFIEEIDGDFYDEIVDSKEDAYKLLVEMKDVLGIENPSKQILFIRDSSDKFNYLAEYIQCIDKIPVVDHTITIVASKKNGKPHILTNLYDSTAVVTGKVEITKNQAKKTAAAYTSTENQKFEAIKCELCIYDTGKYRFAYNITVEDSIKHIGYQVYINAVTNEVITANYLYPIVD